MSRLALAAACLAGLPARAADRAGNALELLDAFLARAAAVTPAYRADLRAGGDPGRVPPGREFGRSPTLGPFTYRPRRFAELAPPERAAVLRDPALRAFLAGLRAGARPLPIPPEEMLRPGPLVVLLPPP